MKEKNDKAGEKEKGQALNRAFAVFSLLAAITLPLKSAVADIEIFVIHPLNFGSFAVAKNDTPLAITVTPDNEVIAEDGIVIGGPVQAQRGEYLLTGLPGDVTFQIGVEFPNDPSEGGIVFNEPIPVMGPGPDFTLSDFTIGNGGILQTTPEGEATLYVGATLRTNGTMERYTTGSFSGQAIFRLYHEGDDDDDEEEE